jgi:hypothetical protein
MKTGAGDADIVLTVFISITKKPSLLEQQQNPKVARILDFILPGLCFLFQRN